MKIRINPALRRHLLTDSSRFYGKPSSRRGFCVQCRPQNRALACRAGLRPYGGPAARSTNRKFALPATFVAGQRRSLATVQNGISLHLEEYMPCTDEIMQ